MFKHRTSRLPRRATGPIGKGFQRGVTVIEAVIVVSVLIVLMTLGISYLNGLALASRGAQFNDEEAREMAQLARATAKYMDAQPAATYPVGTNVAVPITSLTAAGFLPAGFANRGNASPSVAITPLAQAYVVGARRLVATDKPTAVVVESGSANVTKTSQIGIDGYQDALVFGVKQSIAALANKNYQVIAGTIPTGSRIATGTGNAFTEDLTAYFTAGFTQGTPVVFVNFKDLDPGGGGGTPAATAQPLKVYDYCNYVIGNCAVNSNCINAQWGRAGPPAVTNCQDPVGTDPNALAPTQHFERSSRVSDCQGPAITPIPVGGAFVNGYYDATSTANTNNCSGQIPGCQNNVRNGSVTIANLQLIQDQCSTDTWQSGTQVSTNYAYRNIGVCCAYEFQPQ